MLNANLRSTAVMLITKNIILLLLDNHISHNLTIHIDKRNYIVLLLHCTALQFTMFYKRSDKTL